MATATSPLSQHASRLINSELTMLEDTGYNIRKVLRRGEPIFYEGAIAKFLFLIFNGKVKIESLGEGGRPQILRLAKSGDILCYRALLSENNQYNTTAVALVDTTLHMLPKDNFRALLLKHNELSNAMLMMLSEDLASSELFRVQIATKTVRQRLALVLLLLKATFGVTLDQITIDVPIKREDLAAMVGAAKEVVIRTLTSFKKEGLVEVTGRKIGITNITQLKLLAKSN